MPDDSGPIYRLRFGYEVNGRMFHAAMDTSSPESLLGEAAEPIPYDSQNPRKSALLDELPAHGELDATCNIKHRDPLMGFVCLLTPPLYGGLHNIHDDKMAARPAAGAH